MSWGARRGAGRQAQMAEDLDDYRRTFDGGPSTRLRTGDDLRGAAAVRAVLTVDVGRLELVFVNLLSNAIKYCDPAKPVRSVEVTGQEKDGDRRLIVVRDNGLGIPQEALASIFRRFTRVHPQRDEISGLGLGLSIVEDCLRTLGGTVQVESTEGVGSAFALTLSVTPPSSPRS
jgi:signal transduction histidine kinase